MRKRRREVTEMNDIILKGTEHIGVDDIALRKALEKSIEEFQGDVKKVLLLPPDFTRSHSMAGKITALYYELLHGSCQVDIMPALGTHMPMTEEEIRAMFGPQIPLESFLVHDWRNDVVKIGEVPGDFVREVSDGLVDFSIDVEVNKRLTDGSYDLILSIGQVVPHEVVGMANYSKNIFVGCGGSKMINKTHFLGAVYGLERMMGKDHSPVRKVFDYAQEKFAKDIPLVYVLTVTSQREGQTSLDGLFIGKGRRVFEEAVALSQARNLDFMEHPLRKVVVFLDEKEFKSTWLGNKAIYRTRMAIADGGELLILAPGVKQFGEDPQIDVLIRKYGYVGREKVLALTQENEDLQNNLSAAAHLIHGSSDGRFRITYAVDKLTREEVEGVNFRYMPLEEAYAKYHPGKLVDGFNVLEDGEEIFYVSNPALGLWVSRDRFE